MTLQQPDGAEAPACLPVPVKPRYPFVDIRRDELDSSDVASVLTAYYRSMDNYNSALPVGDYSQVEYPDVPAFRLSRGARNRAMAHASRRLALLGESAKGRELPRPEYGYCYLAMVQTMWCGVAAAHLGFSPTLTKLLECPRQWFRPIAELESLRVGYSSEGCLHMDAQGPWLATAAFAGLSVRAQRWPRASIACELMREVQPGFMDPGLRLLDVLGRDSTSDCAYVPGQEVWTGAVGSEGSGFCYLKVVQSQHVRQVAQLGSNPRLDDLLRLPRGWFKDGRVLRTTGVIWFSARECHLVDRRLEHSAADLFVAAARACGPGFPSGSLGERSLCATVAPKVVFPVTGSTVCGSDQFVATSGADMASITTVDGGEYEWYRKFEQCFPGVVFYKLRYLVAPVDGDSYAPATIEPAAGLSRGWYRVGGAFTRGAFLVLPPGTKMRRYAAVERYTVVRLGMGVDLTVFQPGGLQPQVYFWGSAAKSGTAYSWRFARRANSRTEGASVRVLDSSTMEMVSPVMVADYVVEGRACRDWRFTMGSRGSAQVVERAGRYGEMRFSHFNGPPGASAVVGTSVVKPGLGRETVCTVAHSAYYPQSLRFWASPGSELTFTTEHIQDEYAFDGGGLSIGQSEFSGY